MIVYSRKSKKGGIIKNEIIFNDENANLKSRASYVLLKEKLRLQDEDFLFKMKSFTDWLDAREIFLLRRKKENNGNLTCDYCKKSNLDIGGKTPKEVHANNKNKNLATVDHIDPLMNEGEKFNEDNMCVSCKKCNRRKGAKTLNEFLSTFSSDEIRKVSSFLLKLSNVKLF